MIELPLGISYGVPREAYEADAGYRQSTLKAFGKSRTPDHFAASPPFKDTPSLREGNYVDCAIHGAAEDLAKRFAVWPADRTGQKWKAFSAASKGKTILNKTEYAIAERCLLSLARSEDTQRILAACNKQIVVVANHPVLGCRLKGALDLVPDRTRCSDQLWPFIFDVKISEDASPEGFSDWCYEWGYHVQAYYYIKLMEYCSVMVNTFGFIVVETKPPHLVKIHFINRGSPEYIAAEQLVEEWLPAYHDCVTRNWWPGYGPDWSEIKFNKPWQLNKRKNIERESLV